MSDDWDKTEGRGISIGCGLVIAVGLILISCAGIVGNTIVEGIKAAHPAPQVEAK